MKKKYITSQKLLNDSFSLAKNIAESAYKPTFILGLWRGGAPIAIAVHEVLEFCKIPCNHYSLRISSYSGIENQAPSIKIFGLNDFKSLIKPQDNLLIVDDVHDTGLSMQTLLDEINSITTVKSTKIAVLYYKPNKSKVDFEPDFYIEKESDWLVFPHEICGLNKNELLNDKPEINHIRDLLMNTSKA